MPTGLETISIAYNGMEICKLDLLMYLNKLITLREQSAGWIESRKIELQNHIAALQMERKRRTYYERIVEKPTGLAALSGSKRRAYEQWLADAPKREQEKLLFEKKEDNRIAAVEEKIASLEKERDDGNRKALLAAKEFMEVCHRQIIPPEYRKDDIPKILFLYLYNGRAHTLEAAINLYHQELHYQKMEEIAKQQARQAQAAYYAQMQAISDAEQERRAAINEIRDEVSSARRSIENIEFNTDMIFWLNLMDK